MSKGYVTRAVKFNLDPTPSQERLLRSYCGAVRVAHNWALSQAKENLSVRATERGSGVADANLTPSLSWSKFSLQREWNAAKADVAPWWSDVSTHAFGSGVIAAAAGLANFSNSRKGTRVGRAVGFPRFKSRHKATLSVSFVETNHQLSWLRSDRHHVRLMLPKSPGDPDLARRREQLAWIHTIESTRRLYRLVETDRATIQKVTISYRGGRWQVSFQVRHALAPDRRPVQRRGGLIGVDAGISHLATLSVPVPGLTDNEGHVVNPRILHGQLVRLAKLDRTLARKEKGSKNRARVLRQRARLHGRITKTRALHLHRVTNALAGGFDIVAIEDLNVAGMSNRKRHLGRALADASLGELRRQLTYKTTDYSHILVAVDRFYPSSKTCSACGAVKAKLHLGIRVYDCVPTSHMNCDLVLDRDVNAARNIAREGARLLEHAHQQDQHEAVAGLRPETPVTHRKLRGGPGNADPRPHKTRSAHAGRAAIA